MSDFDLDAEDLDLSPDDDEDEFPVSVCHHCGATFAGNHVGHCSGGPYRQDYPDGTYSGCCQNFASSAAFDKHRTGPHGGNRRCFTVEELTAKGWAKTGPHDSWRTPAPPTNPWRRTTP